MSNFVPAKGDYFYTSCKPRKRIIGGGIFDVGVAEKVVETQDHSYSGYVFQCMGRDDHALAAERRPKGAGFMDNYTFVIAQYNFAPVGPEMMQALGLSTPEAAA